MNHKMNLQAKYFNYIKSGTKRIELRLFDEKRSMINLGDTIEFANAETGEKLTVKVRGLLRYGTFEDLFQDFDIDLLADKSMGKAELLDVLGEFYPNETQGEYGVLGIRIEL